MAFWRWTWSWGRRLRSPSGLPPPGVGVAGSAVTLTLATAVEANQAVTLAYAPGTNPIQDAAGNGAAPLPAQTVTNNTGRADVTPPTLTQPRGESPRD